MVTGRVLLTVGLVLLFIPGPAVVVIISGLAILAVEFAWAERAMTRIRWLTRRLRGKRGHQEPPEEST